MRTKFEKYEVVQVNRQDIKRAPYNPRQIDVHAKRKLRENMKRVGLLAPIIVNKRTGHVVSGHQRLAVLDTLEGKPDYELQVAYVDLSEQEEKQQNIFLNNEAAMGSFDAELLENLISEVDFKMAGFDEADLQLLLPSLELPTTFEEDSLADDVEEQQKKVEEMRKLRKEMRKKHKEEDAISNCLLTIVFEKAVHLDGFLKMIAIDSRESYISAEKFFSAIKANRGWEKAEFATEGNRTGKAQRRAQKPAKI